MGIFVERARNSTFTQLRPDYPHLGDSEVTVVGLRTYTIRRELEKGDHRTPTPYYHTTITQSGYQNYDHWKWDYTSALGWASHHNVSYSASRYSGPSTYQTWFTISPDINCITVPPFDVLNECDNIALGNLNKEAIDIGSALAEIMETAHHFASRAGQLVSFAIAVKRGKWRRALDALGINERRFNTSAKNARHIAELYLEYQWAIRPVIKDIDSAVKLHKFGLSHLPLMTIAAKGKVKIDIDEETVTGTSFQSEKKTVTLKGRQFNTTKVFALINDVEVIAEKALGVDSIVPGIWEFLPFSWLVDYAVDVSGLIDAWTGTKGLSFQSGYRSTKLILKAETQLERDDSSLPDDYVGHKFVYDKHYIDRCNGYRRSLLTTFPNPSLRLAIGGFNTTKALNLAALATILRHSKTGVDQIYFR